jgi:NTE family protein
MPGLFRSRQTPISLAPQGGGAHGAFTWGVLDRLLEDGRVSIAALSGTSAGALNAVVLADGLLADGHDGARAALQRFWRAVGSSAPLDAVQIGSDERPAFAPAARAWMH